MEKEYKWSPQNPSPSAMEKVKDPLPVPNFCVHCGSPVRPGTHAEIYDGRSFGVWPHVYLCENKECGAYVGLHPFTNIPLGHLATEAERAAPPQPVPIQLDTWSLRTGDALDPAKRCDPPVLYEGHWYPMICPVEGDFQ